MMKLYYIAAMDMLGFAMIIPIFSSYLYSLDPSRTVMGFVMSSESLIKVLWNPIAGSLSDTTGRKYMIVQSLILLCISNILMTVSSSLLVIFLARFCSALGSQLQSLLRITISENAKDNQRFAALNKLGAVHSLCFITGVILGGFLSETKNGVTYIFAIVSLLTLFSTGLALCFEGNRKSSDENVKDLIRVLKRTIHNIANIKWSNYWDVFCINALVQCSYSIMQFNLILLLTNKFEISGRYVSFVFVFMSLFSIFTNIFIVKIKTLIYYNDSGSSRLMHATFLFIVAYLGLGLSNVYYVFILFLGIHTIPRTVMDSTLTEILSVRTNDVERGGVMTAFDNMVPIAGFLAPIPTGILVRMLGEQYTILFALVPVVGIVFVLFIMKNVTKVIKNE